MKVKSESEVTQSCLTLSVPINCSPPGSSVHGIFQARVLEWLGWEDPLEKEMATHSTILAWRIPWTEEPSRVQFMGLARVGCNLASMHALEKEMATHFSNLAWRIPGMEEPGGLPSMGSHRVKHD